MSSFANRLKQLRKSHDITQVQLAEETNISQSLIAQYESGKKDPGLKIAIRIADYFGVTLDFISGRELGSK